MIKYNRGSRPVLNWFRQTYTLKRYFGQLSGAWRHTIGNIFTTKTLPQPIVLKGRVKDRKMATRFSRTLRPDSLGEVPLIHPELRVRVFSKNIPHRFQKFLFCVKSELTIQDEGYTKQVSKHLGILAKHVKGTSINNLDFSAQFQNSLTQILNYKV